MTDLAQVEWEHRGHNPSLFRGPFTLPWPRVHNIEKVRACRHCRQPIIEHHKGCWGHAALVKRAAFTVPAYTNVAGDWPAKNVPESIYWASGYQSDTPCIGATP